MEVFVLTRYSGMVPEWEIPPHMRQGVFGVLKIGEHHFATVERPWAMNRPRESCIPDGTYSCEPHVYSKAPDKPSWILSGGTVGKWKTDNMRHKRYAILIHVGNTMDDLTGCIAPGMGVGYVNGKWGVVNSTGALRKMKELLPQTFMLRIRTGHVVTSSPGHTP